METPKLILASASPRRRELMQRMGLAFDVVPSRVDESAIPADHPRTFANRAAWLKAKDVAERCEPGTLVVASDTVVTLRSVILGKPADAAEARRMLRFLSGQRHEVITAVALAPGGGGDARVESATTAVAFRTLDEREIDDYIATGSPFDKAGAYGIQDGGGAFVERLEGDWYNVMGLPCALLASMLAESVPSLEVQVPPQPPEWRSRS